MALVSSFTQEVAQKGGRRWTLEKHIDDFGVPHEFYYLADAGFDCNALMLLRASKILEWLADQEIAENIAEVTRLGSLASPKFVYSTAAANASALRVAYATMTREDAIMAGDFLSTLTDAQLRNAFNITQAQVDTLRANKLTPAATLAAEIRAATGA